MKVISQLYSQYQIMPSLQLHMYRVAAVASLICESFEKPLERQALISACLLHDMGNILKFDLQKFPEFLRPEGLKHWQKIKTEFTQKYGDSEHEATFKIAAEIGVSDRTMELIKSIGFQYTPANYESVDVAKKICQYADYRVTPHGITSLLARMDDLKSRYAKQYPSAEDIERRQHYKDMAIKIETDIFAQTSIKPDQITEASASDTIALLHDFVVN